MLSRLVLILATAALLFGCNGAGGNSSQAAGGGDAVATFALDTFQSNLFKVARSFTATATDGADTYTLFFSIAPATDALFEGAIRKRAVLSFTIRKNGVTISATNGDYFYQANPWQNFGMKFSSGPYAVATTLHPALPNNATVGSTGSLGVITHYTNSRRRIVALRQESTWTLEEDTANTAFFCENAVIRNTSGAVVTTGSSCSRIDTSGNIIGIRFTIAVNDLMLTFQ